MRSSRHESRDQGHTASFRFPKPNLTIDTSSPSKFAPDTNPAQSAPVGTRQEKGIPPMYQAFDRYCDKLAEMMDSPTWRSQNPGPHVPKVAAMTISSPVTGNDDTKTPSSSNREDTMRDAGLKGNSPHAFQDFGQCEQDLHNDPPRADEIYLGQDSELIKVHSIYRFPIIPQTSTNGTYIIAASVSRDPSRPQANSYGETQDIYISELSYELGGKTAERSGILDTAQQEDDISDQEKSSRGSSRHDSSPDEVHAGQETKREQLDAGAVQLMKLDPAIESINHWSRSPRRQHQPSPNGEERFRGLLERLKPQEHIDPKAVDALLNDPAILKIGPGTSNRRKHAHNDSGYGSEASRPRTREQSRATNRTSDTRSSETFSVEQKSNGPNGSELDKSSKNSSLNPAAQEFSSAKSHYSSPVKTGGLPRSDVPNVPVVPQHWETTWSFSPPRIGAASNHSAGTWSRPLADGIFPSMGYPPMQQASFPILPGVPPHPSPGFTGAMMPPLPGTNPLHFAPALPSFPELPLGMAPPIGLGLSGIAQPLSLTAPSLASPFHQQLPYTISCNNPSHLNLGTLGAQPLPAAVSMVQTPQTATTSMHVGQPSFIPKHVPKPKVPNRELQQNWELMHELRRMHEPGYAQKCKEKQRKRFMRQLEKGSQL